MGQTLVVATAHPDDEVGAAGAILAQRARGDRVVLLWLTRGEMTEALGPRDPAEVAGIREEMGARAAEMLDAEYRFLDFPDTRLEATPDAMHAVARVLADLEPDGIVTWGDSWVRGVRHPDHDACGRIVRGAVTLARVAKVVAPAAPHRAWCPVFTLRDTHSRLPAAAIDAEPYLDGVFGLADFYRERVGFGDREWLTRRLRTAGEPYGLSYAEVFDAWESEPGVWPTLLPVGPGVHNLHPARPVGGG